MKKSYLRYELNKDDLDYAESGKAIKVNPRYTGKIVKNEMIYEYDYIPVSLLQFVEDKVYIPSWLVSQKGIWNCVIKDDSIIIDDGKKRKTLTKEERIIKQLNEEYKKIGINLMAITSKFGAYRVYNTTRKTIEQIKKDGAEEVEALKDEHSKSNLVFTIDENKSINILYSDNEEYNNILNKWSTL